MSRIHEALKKAEQERALSQGGQKVDLLHNLETHADAAVISTAAVVSAAAPAPVFASESLLERSRITHWRPDPKSMLFFGGDQHLSGMEEFRTLRSRLYQAREKQPLSKLLVTSPLPREGKSFTAANLAQVIVLQHGKRALLIDADLRNPQLHTLLGAEAGPGLSEYLQSEVDEGSILQRGPMENLFLIPAGRNNQNPAELVANGRMKFLMNRLEALFDWIIVDSPPAALVSDAALLANYCDGVLLVVRSNNTPVDAARKAKQEFAEHNVVGVVLNGIAADLSPYSQYYYPSYGKNGKAEAKN
jgi:capsular exopolysaccharide synthesis family protein